MFLSMGRPLNRISPWDLKFAPTPALIFREANSCNKVLFPALVAVSAACLQKNTPTNPEGPRTAVTCPLGNSAFTLLRIRFSVFLRVTRLVFVHVNPRFWTSTSIRWREISISLCAAGSFPEVDGSIFRAYRVPPGLYTYLGRTLYTYHSYTNLTHA
jgi:hypothetical protein